MEWRCEWCGKPHEENDPPCDNCGHGKFEKAVVRQTDLGDGESNPALVWVCTECGREHPKNSPPCSRCGAASLEKRRQEIDEGDLTAPGYLDLLTPQYLAAAAVALLLVVVFVLGVTGIVDVPGFGNGGVPDVENVPGNATHSGSVSLAAVETEFTGELNSRLEGAGAERVQRDGDLDDVARNINQQFVRSEYRTGAATPALGSQLRDVVSDSCDSGRWGTIGPLTVQAGDGAAPSAASLGDRLVDAYEDRLGTVTTVGSRVGVDAHAAPDGSVWLLVVTC